MQDESEKVTKVDEREEIEEEDGGRGDSWTSDLKVTGSNHTISEFLGTPNSNR